MTPLEIISLIFLVVLLIAAVFIVVAVIFQKTGEDGLSSSIAGGAETFYGKDKSAHTDKLLFKGTLIAGIVFVVATLLVFILQPDYADTINYDLWKQMNSFSYIFGE
jgi:preprotein translocase subunit SecG